MKQKRTIAIVLAIGVIGGLIALLVVTPLRRRHATAIVAPKPSPEVAVAGRTLAQLPPEAWSDAISALEEHGRWNDLAGQLGEIEQKSPDVYRDYRLAYLRARALIEADELDDAAELLKKFLAQGDPFRDLALYHLANIEDESGERDAAIAHRVALIEQFPASFNRRDAIDDLLDDFDPKRDAAWFLPFAARVRPSAETSFRRDLDARTTAVFVEQGKIPETMTAAFALLKGGVSDDAAERVSRLVDRADIVPRCTPDQLILLGQAAQNHRHFDRAVALLSAALAKHPQKTDDLLFAIGRSYFGDEKYEQAKGMYLRLASTTKDAKTKATALFHASRCAQLLADDHTGEALLTQAIAVPGKFPATTAAVTQRIRTRAKQRRYDEARGDLEFLRKNFANDHSVVEGSVALATAYLAAHRSPDAIALLAAIPRAAYDKYDPSEIAYWKARALELTDAPASVATYLQVLGADVPTHFAYFARERLRKQHLAVAVRQLLAKRRSDVAIAIAEKQIDSARAEQTDVFFLSDSAPAEREHLRQLYLQSPKYAAIVNLQPQAFPHFPFSGKPARGELLLAMRLFDDAVDEVIARYPLRPLSSGFTQSLALNAGAASKDSIMAAEVMMNSVPRDFVPELLPRALIELLYPRYFAATIEEDAKRFSTDPMLVLSIMREESRFNPRAKSEAAARGLLQFIITTARDVGRDLGIVDLDAEDLYDPRVVIELGAKYIAELTNTFNGNRYAAAAAYNAGPNQTKLWLRLAPDDGNDAFLSAINFDETKHYVRKVLNSYERYGELYGGGKPAGGTRAEP